ncbi:glycerophosphoryl diester phosphodiesterase [Propionibacterium cyclohexanicum]|uniref:Glycerophosphoryl diester phosphodiesterase n=1 Tax=Propionibacterium cyclohexanicum TaxID=64702 RepID=A0A1H9SY46_9ACTN|nr:glycerophosphodiester phosphodiesterase [Propionibacterium cyclohexanicum]SER89865.1 glycerophosphoryl diester phosphodiesterase [Propionibacterium cyclohexanicum]
MTLVWAHRGASKAAPENTLPAFERAAELGADGVELDVQRTADGELVVCHDEQIDRTSDGRGFIAEYCLDELRGFDFANHMSGFGKLPIPTLADVLDLLKETPLTVNIELKNSVVAYPGMESQVAELVHRCGWDDRVLYSSFNHRSMRAMADRGYRAGLLYETVMWKPQEYGVKLGAAALHPAGTAVRLNPHCVRKAHGRGLSVNVWTIDQPEQIKALAHLEVDAIITNVPDVAVATLR